ncbi:MAG: chorismate mutase, partial [Deinococcus sp.]|nr:chorismate mutase [Deinococcus sp.]
MGTESVWRVRGVRGASTVATDTPEEILAATRELLSALLRENNIHPQDIASGLFTVTPDLRSTFPAQAAREMGLTQVPLM